MQRISFTNIVTRTVVLAALFFGVGLPTNFSALAQTQINLQQAFFAQNDATAYRIQIVLIQANDVSRLGQLGAVFLQTPTTLPATVRLVVTGAQLEKIARMGFLSSATDELSVLVATQLDNPKSSTNLLSKVSQLRFAQRSFDAQTATRNATLASVEQTLRALTADERTALAGLASNDADGDGLSDSAEVWWCTNPNSANSNPLSTLTDGQSVQQTKDWARNLRVGPASERPFAGWPMVLGDAGYKSTCVDGDRDGVPDAAEKFELGMNPNNPTTDGDKYNDGQELFGLNVAITGWLPIGITLDTNVFMPAFVKAPGKHPLVAAFPKPEIDVVKDSFEVQTVTTITTERNNSENKSVSYSTERREGTSTSEADTVTWNE